MVWLVYHHTGKGPARPTAEATAAYQVGKTSHLAFPAVAYSLYVEADGRVCLLHDLETVTWHAGTGSPTAKLGVGVFNWASVGCCFSGEDPTPEQLRALREVGETLDEWFGRKLKRLGHREVSKGTTECPGARYLEWIAAVR